MNRRSFLGSILLALCLTSLVSAADRYWLGGFSSAHNSAANWSDATGGPGGASVPGTGDDAIFDGNGNAACDVGANWALANLTTVAGYTAKLDLVTYNLTMDDGGNVTLDQGGEFDRGTGTITCSGDFDCVDVTTFTDGGGLLVLNGTANQTLAGGAHDIGDVEIDKATSGDVDITSGTMQLADVDMGGGDLVITSTITSSADAKGIEGAFDIGDAGNDVNMGSATWTLTDCALDYDDIGTLTATSAAVVFAGTCTVQGDSSVFLPPSTIAASGTTTVLAVGENVYSYGMIINGTFSVESGKSVLVNGGVDVVLNTGGRITGAGTILLVGPTSTHGLTVHDGTIDIAVFRVVTPLAGAVVAPGTFSCTTLFKVDNTGASDKELELSGDNIFDCDFEVENTGAGDMEIKNSTNNPNITFMKDVIWDQQAGSITYTKGTGTITAASSSSLKNGWGFTFNGVSDNVAVGAQVHDFSGTFTIAAWVRLPKLVPAVVQMITRQGTNGRFYISTDGSLRYNTNGDPTSTAAGLFTAQTWHHVMVTNDGTDIKLYIDNVERATETKAAANSANDCHVGSATGTVQFFDGQLSDVRVWNNALSEANRNALYNAGDGTTDAVDAANCLLWYKMDEYAATTAVVDSGTGSNDGTSVRNTNLIRAQYDQDWDLGAAATEALVQNKDNVTDELTFSGGWTATSFTATKGTLDFNAQTLETVGNWTMGTDSQVVSDADAMNGVAITVGGNLALDGSDGDRLKFLATAGWTITVTGTTDANWVECEYSDASGGTKVNATYNCVDGDNNTDWSFVVPWHLFMITEPGFWGSAA